MLRLCIWAALVATALAMTELNVCDDDDPRCTFPKPNKLQANTLVRVADSKGENSCFCPRGQERGQSCMTTDECSLGTYCAAPARFETHLTDKTQGVCTGRCENHFCPEYTQCHVNATGSPECHGKAYRCADEVDVLVCALEEGRQDGLVKTFPNMCYLVNENFQRSTTRRIRLQQINCATQAAVYGQ